MSRARDQVWLIHSVKQHDLGPDDLRRKLVSFFDGPGQAALDELFQDIDQLERQARLSRRRGSQPEPYESWFEVDVALELLRQKYRIRPQVNVADKRIDLVVDGLDARLGVECDGDEWHGAEEYEHDMARQRQLERAGWTFVRVRESEFYADRETAVRTITTACEELGIRPLDFVEDLPSQESLETAVTEESDGRSSSRAESPVGQDPGENDAKVETAIAEYGPFTGYSEALGFADPRDSSQANVRAVLRQIIERDGPLTRASACRLYVEGCPGLQRVGRVVRQALNRTLGAMLRAGEIVQEDELRDGSPEGQVLRVARAGAVKVRPAGRRDLLEIPPSELLAVLRSLRRSTQPMNEDEEPLLRSLLDHYGFSRLTKPRREYLSKVLRLHREQGKDTGTMEWPLFKPDSVA
jgi:very-short-patch-repair endonuclease